MAAKYNITINKYSDFSRTFSVKTGDVATDLSGSVFTASVRPSWNSDTVTQFTTSIVNAAQGLFKITLTDTQTAAMQPGDQVWDLRWRNAAGEYTRLLEGKAVVVPGADR
jgi:hypothetical protein